MADADKLAIENGDLKVALEKLETTNTKLKANLYDLMTTGA